MAQIVDWEGRQVPVEVCEALVTPWRGQENLRGKDAQDVLAFFSDTYKFANQAAIGEEATAPERLTAKQNVKTVMRIKAEGERAKAHTFSFNRINQTRLLELVLKSDAVPDEAKRKLCEGRGAAKAKEWLLEHSAPAFEDLPAAEAELARAEEAVVPEYEKQRAARQATLRDRFVRRLSADATSTTTTKRTRSARRRRTRPSRANKDF